MLLVLLCQTQRPNHSQVNVFKKVTHVLAGHELDVYVEQLINGAPCILHPIIFLVAI